ncbi:hypothetical protein OF829_09475 [Sphingomonas sp. LB-2]|uniref:hypothetical protein n=1 Tax=Sphingomonas caeni TaxID=2984949 RepID=UPI00222FFEC7|nr:hypothetical protein [Sphingomonas caeni]MCW3847472.1 hypothetical protein [Sphingomonas caeni]
MYKKRTVFVIGAGCSHEFDLPLGPKLRDHIFSAALNGTSGVVGQAMLRAPIPNANIDIDRRMAAFANGLHSKASIDQYLHFHREDEWKVMLGKCAIAATILESERASKLARGMVAHGMLSIGDTWLLKLFHGMNDDTDLPTVERLFQNVSFICFNYDRCVEVAFFNAIRFLTDAPLERVAEVMQRLRIWHPYGTVGTLDFQSFGERNALLGFPQTSVGFEEVLQGAKLLRTFTQGMDDEKILAEMRTALSEAEQVVYLGFSFLDQNMELLKAPTPKPSSAIYATTLGLSSPDKNLARWAMASATVDPASPDEPLAVFRRNNAIAERRKKVDTLHATASEFFDHFGNALRR